jgi:hypothetical protein
VSRTHSQIGIHGKTIIIITLLLRRIIIVLFPIGANDKLPSAFVFRREPVGTMIPGRTIESVIKNGQYVSLNELRGT